MTNFQQTLLQTSARIAVIEPSKALDLLGREGVCFVDLRDGYEIEQYGQIPGAEHCPRGSLEFRIPDNSEYHSSFFSQSERFVF
ncbi:MAG: rhodanese-like domain-containing protein, partial [Hyphomicrobiaceae bacterium]|nr:rhodanese-like domain-containing protein [Hyphomicrobiaceae bacterium]